MNLRTLLSALFLIAYLNPLQAKTDPKQNNTPFCFIENKGQIKDQHGNSRNDIQYSLRSGGINVFIGNGALHYQFAHENIDPAALAGIKSLHRDISSRLKEEDPTACASISTYRMDVELVGANTHTEIVAEDKLAYYENYYLPGIASGTQVHAYKRITYRNVYNGIDWIIYVHGSSLEHEFVVKPGADASKIKLKYSGQQSLKINEDGSITATTPMGTIHEHAPVCYRADGSNTPSSFKLKGNILSYELNGYHDALVIDPVLEWGTYYGPNTSTSPFYSIASDRNANVYASGYTYSSASIATTGTFQSIFGGSTDAFVVKFDSSGNRLWATYYGGTGDETAYSVACDTSGNVYLGGTTNSTTGISTAGTQQTSYGGGSGDCFLAKLNSSGARLWGTYLGGSGANIPGSIACDRQGHVYIGGVTTDATNTSTVGSYQPVRAGGYDDFLVQYDAATGLRQWGTYYGGPGDEFSGTVCSDGNYVYLCGWTNSTSGISSVGSQQPGFGGTNDAFLAKFNVLGVRQWGTYYGGAATEQTGSITCDKYGNIYLLSNTGSDAGIATPGAFQPARSGFTDAFLAKFEPELGLLLWSTYYGGPAMEDVRYSRITTDDSANVYIAGFTASTSGIASAGAWQDTFGGGDDDAFLAKYNGAGVQYWSTYYGGDGSDEATGCAFDGRSVYICGHSNSDNNISTPGSYQPTGSGPTTFYYPGFVAKFNDYVSVLPGPIGGSTHLCIGFPTTMTNIEGGGTWTSSNTSVATIGSSSGIVSGVATGTATITYTVSAGIVTTTVTVNIPPTPIIGVDTFCMGYSTTLNDVTPGGVWSSSNTSVATIGYYTGVLHGVSVGTSTITYTDTVTTCYAVLPYYIKNCGVHVPVISNDDHVAVYPNPVAEQLTIHIYTGAYNSFSITNEAGQVVMKQQISATQTTVNVKSLPPGVYYITLNGDMELDVRKFIKL